MKTSQWTEVTQVIEEIICNNKFSAGKSAEKVEGLVCYWSNWEIQDREKATL